MSRHIHRAWLKPMASAFAAVLVGCGGGKAEVDGLWLGSNFGAAITTSGELWGFYTEDAAAGGQKVTLLAGSAWTSSSALAGDVRAYTPTDSQEIGLFGHVVERQALAATIDVCCSADNKARRNVAIAATYLPSSRDVPSLSWLAGRYSLTDNVLAAISPQGSVVGNKNACTFTGTVAPDTGGLSLFRLRLTFSQHADCPFPGETVPGVIVSAAQGTFIGLTDGRTGVVYLLPPQ